MGVHGMSQRAGFTTPNLLEAETNKAFVAPPNSSSCSPTTPSGTPSGWRASPRWRRADTVVSDAGLDMAARDVLAANTSATCVADAHDPVLDDTDLAPSTDRHEGGPSWQP